MNQVYKMRRIWDLPPELLLEIFMYLPPEDVVYNVQNVSQSWRQMAQHPSLWQYFVYTTFTKSRPISVLDVIQFVEKCPMLKHIHTFIGEWCNGLELKDLVSAVVSSCSDLRTFCVRSYLQRLTASDIDALFAAFPDLEFFEIEINSRNTAEIVDRVSKCTRLKGLRVHGDNESCDWVRQIVDGCLSLEHLDIDVWIPQESYFYILANMKDRLKYLNLDFRYSIQKTVDAYGSFTKLEQLKLNHHKEYGRVDFSPLSNIRTLKDLDFNSYTQSIEDIDTIFNVLFLSPFPLLEKLTIVIYFCDWRRTVFREICRCYVNLKYLFLGNSCKPSTVETIEDIHKLKRLRTLVYRNSPTLTDEDTKHIARCSGLKHLDLQGCKKLTQESIVHITKCIYLEHLSLNNCFIDGESLYLIPKCLYRLKYLDMCDKHIDCGGNYKCRIARMMPFTKVVY